MTPPWACCAACETPLYPRLARRTDAGWVCAVCPRTCADCGTEIGRRSRTVRCRRCAKAATARARREDIEWMAATGENATGAARRLGITREGIEAFCARNDMRAVWRLLIARDPRDHNRAVTGEAVLPDRRNRTTYCRTTCERKAS